MRLDWRTDWDTGGNAYGFHYHNSRLRDACQRLGVELDADAPIAVHVGPPDGWQPVAGKFNVLFTAWEYEVLPQRFAEGARRADLIVVPATFLRNVFASLCKPVAVVPLGVDEPTITIPARRQAPRGPNGTFRILWNAAPSRRKGHELLMPLWEGLCVLSKRLKLPKCELYIKTTFAGTEGVRNDFGKRWPVVFDNRKLKRDDYWRLLASSDIFLFTSFGEGFGLTLAEAMRAGCACVYPKNTAMLDYAVGMGVRCENGRIQWDGVGELPCYPPKQDEMLKALVELLTNPRRIIHLGYEAQIAIKRYTWEATARQFLSAVEKHYARSAIRSR